MPQSLCETKSDGEGSQGEETRFGSGGGSLEREEEEVGTVSLGRLAQLTLRGWEHSRQSKRVCRVTRVIGQEVHTTREKGETEGGGGFGWEVRKGEH